MCGGYVFEESFHSRVSSSTLMVSVEYLIVGVLKDVLYQRSIRWRIQDDLSTVVHCQRFVKMYLSCLFITIYWHHGYYLLGWNHQWHEVEDEVFCLKKCQLSTCIMTSNIDLILVWYYCNQYNP